jgi:hypothetical protein
LGANDDNLSKTYDTKFSYHIHPQYLHLPFGQQKKILKQRLLNLGSNIKDKMLQVFSFFFFFKKEKNPKHNKLLL